MIRIARWESKGGASWLELYRDQYGYSYRAVGAGGSLGHLQDDQTAINAMIVRMDDFQPDRNSTPMKRVSEAVEVKP